VVPCKFLVSDGGCSESEEVSSTKNCDLLTIGRRTSSGKSSIFFAESAYFLKMEDGKKEERKLGFINEKYGQRNGNDKSFSLVHRLLRVSQEGMILLDSGIFKVPWGTNLQRRGVVMMMYGKNVQKFKGEKREKNAWRFKGKWKRSFNFSSLEVVAHEILRKCGKRDLKRLLSKVVITMTSCLEMLRVA
jgi:hypothetical protein